MGHSSVCALCRASITAATVGKVLLLNGDGENEDKY